MKRTEQASRCIFEAYHALKRVGCGTMKSNCFTRKLCFAR